MMPSARMLATPGTTVGRDLDTSWPGYEQIPRDIMAGYTILMAEAVRNGMKFLMLCWCRQEWADWRQRC